VIQWQHSVVVIYLTMGHKIAFLMNDYYIITDLIVCADAVDCIIAYGYRLAIIQATISALRDLNSKVGVRGVGTHVVELWDVGLRAGRYRAMRLWAVRYGCEAPGCGARALGLQGVGPNYEALGCEAPGCETQAVGPKLWGYIEALGCEAPGLSRPRL
jgi:hypothetical protein